MSAVTAATTDICKKDPVFLQPIPAHILYDLLERIAPVDPVGRAKNTFGEKPAQHLLTMEVYDIAEQNGDIADFVDNIRHYYRKTKKHYVDSPITYKKFITIVRQICNTHGINYTYDNVYNRCGRTNEYYIPCRSAAATAP